MTISLLFFSGWITKFSILSFKKSTHKEQCSLSRERQEQETAGIFFFLIIVSFNVGTSFISRPHVVSKALGMNFDPGVGGMSSHRSHTVCAPWSKMPSPLFFSVVLSLYFQTCYLRPCVHGNHKNGTYLTFSHDHICVVPLSPERPPPLDFLVFLISFLPFRSQNFQWGSF